MESFSQWATINAKERFSITKYTSNYFSLVVSVKGMKGNPLLCSSKATIKIHYLFNGFIGKIGLTLQCPFWKMQFYPEKNSVTYSENDLIWIDLQHYYLLSSTKLTSCTFQEMIFLLFEEILTLPCSLPYIVKNIYNQINVQIERVAQLLRFVF